LRVYTPAVKPSLWHNGNEHFAKCPCAVKQNEVHALLGENIRPFFSHFASLFLWRPLIFGKPCLVTLILIFYLNCAILSQTSYNTTFWLAKTSHIPINLAARLTVNPELHTYDLKASTILINKLQVCVTRCGLTRNCCAEAVRG